jgi:very-short-patch-repair endonuclease
VVLRDGLRLTTVARTLLDLAEVLPTTQLVAVLDRCEARRLHHPKAVADVMARATGRRGLRGLRRALLIARPQDVLTRSELERRALRMIARHGLPRPEVNQRLYGHEVDLLWRDRGLVVELDGRAYHGDAIALDRDHRRDADLQARGLRVVRFTWRQVVNHERWVIERLERLLAAEVLRLPLR